MNLSLGKMMKSINKPVHVSHDTVHSYNRVVRPIKPKQSPLQQVCWLVVDGCTPLMICMTTPHPSFAVLQYTIDVTT